MANAASISEESALRVARTEELLDGALATWPALADQLQAEGKLAHQTLSLGSFASAALLLGQVEQVAGTGSQAAARYFAVPLGVAPGFAAIAKMLGEGVAGRRPWDGEKLGLGDQIERIVCHVLLGKLEELVAEYASFEESPELFDGTDARFVRPVFARQLLHSAASQLDRIAVGRLTGSLGFETRHFMRGYERVLGAIAKQDAVAFDAGLAACAEEFVARKRSRLVGDEWGYGKLANPVCFDALGTAFCRLAVHNGMEVHPPSGGLYPEAFWRRTWTGL